MDPRIYYVTSETYRNTCLQQGDVVVDDDSEVLLRDICKVFVYQQKVVGEKKKYCEEKLRVEATYLSLVQKRKAFYETITDEFEEQSENNYLDLVCINQPETERYVNAIESYKNVVSQLVSMKFAVCLKIANDDEEILKICGRSQRRWQSVSVIYTQKETYINLKFFKSPEDRRDNVDLNSNYERTKLKDITPAKIAQRYWKCLEPHVSLLVGFTDSVDFESVCDLLTEFGLKDCHNGWMIMKEFDKEKMSFSGKYMENRRHVEVITGPWSNVTEFYKDLQTTNTIEFSVYSKLDVRFGIENDMPYERIEEVRRDVDVWRCKTRRNLLVDVVMILIRLFPQPYVILEILDWLNIFGGLPHTEKINLIYKVRQRVATMFSLENSNKDRKLAE